MKQEINPADRGMGFDPETYTRARHIAVGFNGDQPPDSKYLRGKEYRAMAEALRDLDKRINGHKHGDEQARNDLQSRFQALYRTYVQRLEVDFERLKLELEKAEQALEQNIELGGREHRNESLQADVDAAFAATTWLHGKLARPAPLSP